MRANTYIIIKCKKNPTRSLKMFPFSFFLLPYTNNKNVKMIIISSFTQLWHTSELTQSFPCHQKRTFACELSSKCRGDRGPDLLFWMSPFGNNHGRIRNLGKANGLGRCPCSPADGTRETDKCQNESVVPIPRHGAMAVNNRLLFASDPGVSCLQMHSCNWRRLTC